MNEKDTAAPLSIRFVDRKTGKHLSNRVLSHLASLSRLASADLTVECRPDLGVGIGSLFPILDTDVDTKSRLVSLRRRYKEIEVRARGSRYGGFRTEWQSYLLSDDGAKDLLGVFLKHNPPRKLKLMSFCRWLAQAIGNQNHSAFSEVDKLCPAFSIKPPAASTVRKLLSFEKPALYFMLVPSKLLKKVAR